MALSGFIKQLLETDSVFGSRAKKLTGLNDSAAQDKYISDDNPFPQGFQISVRDFPGQQFILIAILYFGTAPGDFLPVPASLTEGNFFRLGLSNFATGIAHSDPDQRDPEEDRRIAETLDGAVLRADFISEPRGNAIPFIQIFVDKTVGDAPLIAELSAGKPNDLALGRFGPIDFTLDSRIASLIDNQQIAGFSSRGSTRFNLDNTGVADTQDRGGGIASRYAAHYHGDKLINLVSNTRDDNNNPLYGIEINEAQLGDTAFDAVYFPDVPLEYLQSINTGTSTDIRVDYSDDNTSKTIATYGYVGTRGSGSVFLNGFPTPFTNTTNRGTRVTVGSVTFEFDLPIGMQTGNLRRWIPGSDADPTRQLHEDALQLRDVMRIAGGVDFRIDTTTLPTATSQHIGILGSRDEANNVDVSYDRATLATVDIITTTDVRGCTSPRPVSGNEFKTFDDLLNVLSANTDFDVIVKREGSLNTLNFSTIVPGRKIISFIMPSNSDDIFTTPDGNPIFRVEIGSQASNQVIVPAELVLDRLGNVVFSIENPT